MSICDLYGKKRPLLSFEVFPPKPESPLSTIYDALSHLRALSPDFISVTYGAGGGNQERALDIAVHIRAQYGLNVLSHLTCVGASRRSVEQFLLTLRQNGVDSILALRGDMPKNAGGADPFDEYKSSIDLIKQIRDCLLYTSPSPRDS